ncbi:hypothetical protein Hdeb2414_s0007g00247421 [Helianthus debilis subsp. tardiflorus]
MSGVKLKFVLTRTQLVSSSIFRAQAWLVSILHLVSINPYSQIRLHLNEHASSSTN